MPEVSIIVPVYNVEKYLPKCLDSLVGQTFRNIEIICVNDGSPDNSQEILNSYAQKDSRVRVITKENGGLFSARHEGMKYINGKYVIFVDSDDWVSENLVEKCLKAAGSDNPDVVVFGAFSVREKNGKISCKRGGYDFSKFVNLTKNGLKVKDIFKFPPTAWSKMYRTDFLKQNNIRFQEIKNGEDQLFFIHSMLLAKKIKTVDENLYYYIKSRAGAITAVNRKTSLSPVANFYAIEDLIKTFDINEVCKEFILEKYFNKTLSWYAKADEKIADEFYSAILDLQKHLRENYPNLWWGNFKLNKNDSYWKIKINAAIARLIGAKND